MRNLITSRSRLDWDSREPDQVSGSSLTWHSGTGATEVFFFMAVALRHSWQYYCSLSLRGHVKATWGDRVGVLAIRTLHVDMYRDYEALAEPQLPHARRVVGALRKHPDQSLAVGTMRIVWINCISMTTCRLSGF